MLFIKIFIEDDKSIFISCVFHVSLELKHAIAITGLSLVLNSKHFVKWEKKSLKVPKINFFHFKPLALKRHETSRGGKILSLMIKCAAIE